jgi:hypothetical protein
VAKTGSTLRTVAWRTAFDSPYLAGPGGARLSTHAAAQDHAARYASMMHGPRFGDGMAHRVPRGCSAPCHSLRAAL